MFRMMLNAADRVVDKLKLKLSEKDRQIHDLQEEIKHLKQVIMVGDDKRQLMAFFLADYAAKNTLNDNAHSDNFRAGVSAGIDFYFLSLRTSNLYTLRDKLIKRKNEVFDDIRSLPEIYEARDMYQLLEGELSFYIWLIGGEL